MTFIRENAELLMALWIEQTLCRLCPPVARALGPADLRAAPTTAHSGGRPRWVMRKHIQRAP